MSQKVWARLVSSKVRTSSIISNDESRDRFKSSPFILGAIQICDISNSLEYKTAFES